MDCSLSTAELSFGATVEHKMRAFEYDYYTLPNVTGPGGAGSASRLAATANHQCVRLLLDPVDIPPWQA